MLNFRLFRLIFPVVLLSMSFPALAGGVLTPGGGFNSWDLYAFGNGVVIANALSSISAMVAMPGYTGLLDLLGMISIISLAVMAGFDPGKHAIRFLTYVFVSFLVIWSMTGTGGSGGLTASVNIDDMVTQQVYNVNNVPAAIAVPAAVVSDIGQWLTQAMEQNFSYGNTTLAISDGGEFNMAASLTSDLTKIQIGNAGIASSINNYMQDCVVPALANGAIYAGDLMTSTNLWGTLANASSNALLTTYSGPAANSMSQVVTCANAYTDITSDLSAYLPELQSEAAGAWGNTGVGSILAQQVTDATSWLSSGNISNGGATQVEQSAVLNQLSNAFSNMAAITNNNAMVTALALAQAKQSQLSGWVAGSQVFQQMMGYVYAVLQVFIFGITPIILVALLIPGLGAGILKNFGQVLIWLALWNPMFAVVSFIMNSYAQADLSPLLQVNTAGAGGSGWGFTAANIGAISTAAGTMVAAGGFLGTMVPLIAWGLVKGQLAFTEFVTHGIGTSFANSAATEMATGNVSLGNQSMDLTNMNKFNSVHQSSVGYDSAQSFFGDGAGMENFNFGGSQASINGGKLNPTHSVQTGLTAQEKQANVDSASSALALSKQAAQQQTTTLGTEAAQMAAKALGAVDTWNKQAEAARSTDHKDQTSTDTALAHKFSVDRANAAQLGLGLKAATGELASAQKEEAAAKAGSVEERTAAAKAAKASRLIGALAPQLDAALKSTLNDSDAFSSTQTGDHKLTNGNGIASKSNASAGDGASNTFTDQDSAAIKQATAAITSQAETASQTWQDVESHSTELSVASSATVGDSVTVTGSATGEQALATLAAVGHQLTGAEVAGKASQAIHANQIAVGADANNPEYMTRKQLADQNTRLDATAKHTYDGTKAKDTQEHAAIGASVANAYDANKGNAQKQLHALQSEVHALYNLGKEGDAMTAAAIQSALNKNDKELTGYMNAGSAAAAIAGGVALAYTAASKAYDLKHGEEGAFAKKLASMTDAGREKVMGVLSKAGTAFAKEAGEKGMGMALAEGGVLVAGTVLTGGAGDAIIGLVDVAITTGAVSDAVDAVDAAGKSLYDEYAASQAGK